MRNEKVKDSYIYSVCNIHDTIQSRWYPWDNKEVCDIHDVILMIYTWYTIKRQSLWYDATDIHECLLNAWKLIY